MRKKLVSPFIIVVVSAVLFLAALGSWAQENPAPAKEESTESVGSPRVTRVFEVKYVDVRRMAAILDLFGSGARVRPEPELGVIAWSGPADVLPAVEAAVRNLDRPPAREKSVELTAYILAASRQKDPVAPLPEELTSVADQLQKVLGLTGLELLETAILRTREGTDRAQVSGTLPSNVGATVFYDLTVRGLTVSGEADPARIRLERLSLSVQIPVPCQQTSDGGQRCSRSTGFDSELDLRTGQKVVVGKATFQNADESLILVLTAQVIEW